MRNNLFEVDFEELRETVRAWNEPVYRASQLWQGLYQNYWNNLGQFTNLPLSLRQKLEQHFIIGSLKIEKVFESADHLTKKVLYRLTDGAAIETVLMRYKERNTVCISSQVGCGLGCNFCATGNMGLTRNLSQGEIVEQVVLTAVDLKTNGRTLTNVVFMGMGEPFQNYGSVLGAIHVLNDPCGFGMGARRFTISTVGLIPGIKRFTEENTQINLAISLHAADDELRSSIVPINKKYPISQLLAACEEYIHTTGRRITIEWALMDGINDTEDQANKLVSLISGMLVHVNLIQLNPVAHFDGVPATDHVTHKFQKFLIDAGISCTIRLRRGIDIQAGCGQLASVSK